MICPKCLRQIPDGSKFCDGCGASLNNAQVPNTNTNNNYYQQANYANAPQQPYANAGAPFFQAAASDFNGTVLETFVAGLVSSLIMIFTCFIGTPWAITYMLKFIFSHTTIDGKRLEFTGNGAELLGRWILWGLLTLITLGIYSFWVIPKMYKWVAQNTHFVN